VTWSWPGGRLELGHGRIRQVELGGRAAFWTTPEPDGRNVGWNVGGDRLWLGPESDWFWASDDHTDLSAHVVPGEIDPGRWATYVGDRHAVLTADVRLTHRRSGAVTRVRVRREVDLLTAGPGAVSYRTRTTLDVVAGPPGQAVDAWSIVQVPDGGVLDVALAGPLAYRDHLAPAPPERIVDHGDRVAVELTGESMFKIGFAPSVVAGRLTYVLPDLTVERVFDVRPHLPYCEGDAVQVFDDDGHYGGYAELEHHSPAAVTSATGTGRTVDVCVTTVSLHRPEQI
jgi:hypothetical protein